MTTFERAIRRLEREAIRCGFLSLSQTFAVVREGAPQRPDDERWMRDAAIEHRRRGTRRGRRMGRLCDRAAAAIRKLNDTSTRTP